MSKIESSFRAFLDDPTSLVLAVVAALVLAVAFIYRHEVRYVTRFILKSLRRNLLRTILTAMATMVLVLVVTMVWTVLAFLDQVTAEKSKDLKAIVTERWQIPSQMPPSYEMDLARGAATEPDDAVPDDFMSWVFFGGTIDPANKTRENLIFLFCMDPAKMLTMRDGKAETMMDGLDDATPEQLRQLDAACRAMEQDKRRIIVGIDRLKAMNKRVGEWVTITSFNYIGITLECEIIGAFPDGRYNQNAILNRDYLLSALDKYKADNGGKAHAMAAKALNLVWLRMPDLRVYAKVEEQITNSPLFKDPAVKCETMSSGIGAFFEAYRDLLWGMRWLLVPAVLVTMSLVIANAISISVRERRTEMAVLKVLGFGPTQVMILVLGEALLIGLVCGFISSGGTYYVVNHLIGGFKLPVPFFPAFLIPTAALWWGPLIGGATAFMGSIFPAWSVRSVKVSEVFSKIA
jgi:putative ABC transport system permease protein